MMMKSSILLLLLPTIVQGVARHRRTERVLKIERVLEEADLVTDAERALEELLDERGLENMSMSYPQVMPSPIPSNAPSVRDNGNVENPGGAPAIVRPTEKPTEYPTKNPAPSPVSSPSSTPSSSLSAHPTPVTDESAVETPQPTGTPSSPLSGFCGVTVDLTCGAGDSMGDCGAMESQVNLACTCDSGVDYLSFSYEGPDGGSMSCTFGDGRETLLAIGFLSQGDLVKINPFGLDRITCTVSDSEGNPIASPFDIHSSCRGERDLILQQTFGDGDLLIFIGYLCNSSTDEQSCFGEVTYSINICNVGVGTETIDSVVLDITEDGSVIDTMDYITNPPIGSILGTPGDAGDCLYVSYSSHVNICTRREYVVTTTVAIVGTESSCNAAEDKIHFESFQNTLSPTPSLTEKQTPRPTNADAVIEAPTSNPIYSPTSPPTKTPTPYPTEAAETSSPTKTPTPNPTEAAETSSPTKTPTPYPTEAAETSFPTKTPTPYPTEAVAIPLPSAYPTPVVTDEAQEEPSEQPTVLLGGRGPPEASSGKKGSSSLKDSTSSASGSSGKKVGYSSNGSASNEGGKGADWTSVSSSSRGKKGGYDSASSGSVDTGKGGYSRGSADSTSFDGKGGGYSGSSTDSTSFDGKGGYSQSSTDSAVTSSGSTGKKSGYDSAGKGGYSESISVDGKGGYTRSSTASASVDEGKGGKKSEYEGERKPREEGERNASENTEELHHEIDSASEDGGKKSSSSRRQRVRQLRHHS